MWCGGAHESPKARAWTKQCSWSSGKKAESKECGEQRTTSITVPISTKKDSIKIRKGAKRHSSRTRDLHHSALKNGKIVQ